MNTCLLCNKKTPNPKFCSRSCATSRNNVLYPKRSSSRTCSKCSKKVKGFTSSFCLEHYHKYQQNLMLNSSLGDIHSRLSTKNKHPSWANASIRNHNRAYNRHLLTLPCANCGYSKHVELAHIKAVSEFTENSLVRDINDPSNVTQLCPNCHWEFDNLPRIS